MRNIIKKSFIMFVMLISALFTQAIKSEAQYFISYGDSSYADYSQIKIWKTETGNISDATVTNTLRHKNIMHAMFHPSNPNIIISSGWRKYPRLCSGFAQIKIWETKKGDWSDGQDIQTLNHGRCEQFYMMFHPADSYTLISGSHESSKTKIWKTETGDWSDLPQGTNLYSEDKQKEKILYLGPGLITPHPSNPKVFAHHNHHSHGQEGKETFRVFTTEIGDWSDIQSNILKHEKVSKIIFHPKNPNILLSFSRNGSIKTWKTESGNWSDTREIGALQLKKQYSFYTYTIKCNSKNPNIFAFIQNTDSCEIKILKSETEDWSDIRELKTLHHKGIRKVTFHKKDPNMLISESEHDTKIFTTATGDWSKAQEAKTLKGSNSLRGIQFNPKKPSVFFTFSRLEKTGRRAGSSWRDNCGVIREFKTPTGNWEDIQRPKRLELNHVEPQGIVFPPKVVDYQKEFETENQNAKIEMLATEKSAIGQDVLKRDVVQCGFGPGSTTLRCFRSLLS